MRRGAARRGVRAARCGVERRGAACARARAATR